MYLYFVIEKPSIRDILKLYIKSFKYDVIYEPVGVVGKYLGVFKRFFLLKPKLVRIIHHPPFEKDLKYSKSDVSIFFTQELLALAKKSVKDNRKMVVNYWYPDVEWYSKNMFMMSSEKKYDFIDNGKTARDHDKFIRSMKKLPNRRGLVVTDKNHIPASWEEGGNVDLYFQDRPNDFTMQQLCMQSRVMVIPIIGKKKLMA